MEVRGRQLHHYAGDYKLFLEQRELRSQQAASAALTQGKKIAELEGFVARFGAKASKASQAQSRAKQLEKIKSNMVAAPAASAGDGPGDARKVLHFHAETHFVVSETCRLVITAVDAHNFNSCVVPHMLQ